MYSRIVVPYDHSGLSKKALQYAINLAKQDAKIELFVVTVIHAETTLAYQKEAMREAAEDVRLEVEKELQALPNRTCTYILEGYPATTIVEFVKQNDGDLVVMGSRGLSGLQEVFLGSVSHHVVQQATCPVLVIK